MYTSLSLCSDPNINLIMIIYYIYIYIIIIFKLYYIYRGLRTEDEKRMEEIVGNRIEGIVGDSLILHSVCTVYTASHLSDDSERLPDIT